MGEIIESMKNIATNSNEIECHFEIDQLTEQTECAIEDLTEQLISQVRYIFKFLVLKL